MAKNDMSKKDVEIVKYYMEEYGYDLKEEMKKMADSLEDYLDIVDTFEILEGMSEEAYKKSKKDIEKLIKLLRKGRASEAFDKERLEDFVMKYHAFK